MVHSRTPNIRGGNHGDLENIDFSPSGGYLESIACTIPSRLAFIRFMQDYLQSYRPFGRIFFIHLYNLIR